MNEMIDLFFFLLRSVINTSESKSSMTIDEEQCAALYTISKYHDLAAIICYALNENASVSSCEEKQLLEKQYTIALYRHVRRTMAIEQIRQIFNEEKIPFILLKGSFLMDLYPQAWMRTSYDVDVLVKEEDNSKAIKALEKAGMNRIAVTEQDISFSTQEDNHIELHHSLLEDSRYPKACVILKRVWDGAEKAEENGFEFNMSDEMFLFYHIIHMAKHFENGGCGVRPFLDLWFLNNRLGYDDERILSLLEEGGFTKFYNKAKKLSELWFTGREPDEDISDLADYVLKGGIYGTKEQLVAVRKTKSQSRFVYYRKRLFPPLNSMKLLYPVLGKVPFLLPVFWIYRWFKLLDPKVMKRTSSEVSLENSNDSEAKKRTAALLKDLGLI